MYFHVLLVHSNWKQGVVCSMCHRISVSLKLYYLQCQCKMSVTHNSQTLRARCDRRTCNRGQHPLKINVYTDYQKINVYTDLSQKAKKTFQDRLMGYRHSLLNKVKNPFKTISLDLFDLRTILH